MMNKDNLASKKPHASTPEERDNLREQARTWFENLRDQICA